MPADDAALQVELGRDPQVEVAVERVVVGDEGPRQRAAVERLQHRGSRPRRSLARRATAVCRDHLARAAEQLAGLLVGDQVELAVAVARLHVLEAVELVGRRAQALRQQPQPSTRSVSSPVRDLNAVPSTPTMSPRSSATSPSSARRRARRRAPGAGACRCRRRGRGTRPCPCPRRAVIRPATRYAASVSSPPRAVVGRAHRADLDPPVELVGERLDARLAQALELLAPLGDDRRLVALGCRSSSLTGASLRDKR